MVVDTMVSGLVTRDMEKARLLGQVEHNLMVVTNSIKDTVMREF